MAERAVFCYLVLLAVLLAGDRVAAQSSGDTGDPAASPAAHAGIPPDIDQFVPPVKHDVPCPLPEVLRGAAQRVEELVVNLQRFSATEQLEYEEVDKDGRPHKQSAATFSYVASIREIRPGQLAVEEYRDDSLALSNFRSKLATTGTVAHALIFHPKYIEDFAVSCEGQADWQGPKAWQVRFVQRPEHRNNFRVYRVAHRSFPVKLKGRAWIAADTYQVLRLETELVKPIPEIPLLREHISISYRSVDFPKRRTQLWLPEQAEIYMDYRGRRYRHRHTFSDFKLFWVETGEKVKVPKGD